MRLLYYIRRFFEIPGMERKLFCKGFLLSGFFLLVSRIIRFKYYKHLLNFNNNEAFTKENEVNQNINIIKKSLKRITAIAPWKMTCLNKAITFKILSNGLNIHCSLSFDAIKSKNGDLIAHSFISRDNKIIYLHSNQFINVNGLLNI